MRKQIFIRTSLILLIILIIALPFAIKKGKGNLIDADNNPMADKTPVTNSSPIPHPLVAHAGGAVYGFRYTNSLEALEQSYSNGFKLIELDFEWTKDEKIVLIHDWDAMVQRLFMTEPQPFNLEEFKSARVFQDLTLLDLDDLVEWLEKRNDAYIITDIKRYNLKLLNIIEQKYKHIQKQIIPQIYSFEEYSPVKKMGYNNIILTLYGLGNTNDEIVDFVKDNSVFAVTMPKDRGFTDLPIRLREIDIPVYVHTINDLYIFEELNENGVSGIYTDYFQPNHW